MIRATRALVAAAMAAAALIVADDAIAQREDINVNPYGDPIWQQHEPGKSKVRRHVKRARPHARHVRRPQSKPRAHAKVTRSRQRPVGKPLNIIPPAARVR